MNKIRMVKEIMDKQYNILMARFPYGEIEHPGLVDWLMSASVAATKDKRVNGFATRWVNGTPITMTRNRMVKYAIENGVDILFMLDNDNIPHESFYDRAMSLIYARYRDVPTVIAAPYVGPPPMENVYVFRWESFENNDPEMKHRLVQYTRYEAGFKKGFEAVAAIPTGCVAIDMRIFTGFQGVKLPLPWFYYEYEDGFQAEKKSTEDVVWSRNVSALFLATLSLDTVFVDWDSWAGHWKHKMVEKPHISVPANLMQTFFRYQQEVAGDIVPGDSNDIR